MTRTAANNSRSTRDEYEDDDRDNSTKQKPKGKQQEPLSQDLEAKAYRFTRDTQLILAGAAAGLIVGAIKNLTRMGKAFGALLSAQKSNHPIVDEVVSNFTKTEDGKIIIDKFPSSNDPVYRFIEQAASQNAWDLTAADPNTISYEKVGDELKTLDRQLQSVNTNIANLDLNKQEQIELALKTSNDIKDNSTQLAQMQDIANRITEAIEVKSQTLREQARSPQSPLMSLEIQLMTKQVESY
ncbi:hypothetical protein [Chamaesiphon minutus]|uniref:Uncharacterized protein n=1 Tax=Chamaesiphon minutus (strain ATCC 27169 / PCC 6605) TaxID=1173020 RepID=K9UBI1_CHAP6|nr:hypothetical protein [Chamaesiphon minutus]AFY92457.1 hypothetical protein Cha6605_1250 [Chamaesiphon minutus PCC 6605]